MSNQYGVYDTQMHKNVTLALMLCDVYSNVQYTFKMQIQYTHNHILKYVYIVFAFLSGLTNVMKYI